MMPVSSPLLSGREAAREGRRGAGGSHATLTRGGGERERVKGKVRASN
jgi:hypothetical protein